MSGWYLRLRRFLRELWLTLAEHENDWVTLTEDPRALALATELRHAAWMVERSAWEVAAVELRHAREHFSDLRGSD